MTDGELLSRFLASGDQRAALAFEALVVRHGPMVRGVCRRVLADPTDADDAFQATFLILIRRARSVRVDDSLGRWLYGVSRRVAARSRADRDRRRRKERTRAISEQQSTIPEDSRHGEALAILDDEVGRLAEPFRGALVLCDLGGLTHDQAALALGCPVGTVKSRLARGRDRLRARLIRRGVEWDAASPLAGITAVPTHLVASTVRRAIAVQGGSSVVSVAVTGWPSFPNGVDPMMTIPIPVQWLGGTLLAVVLGTTGAAWVASPGDQNPLPTAIKRDQPRESSQGAMMTTTTTAKAELPAPRPERPEYIVEPPDIILVEVLAAFPNRPIRGERLVRPDGKISLGFYGEVYVAGLTVQEIKAKITLHLRQFASDADLGLTTI